MLNRRLDEKDFPAITVFYRTLAFLWLRYEQGCYVVTFERHPWRGDLKPDVLGMNKRRRLVEIELKVSLTDMKRDLDKQHRIRTTQDIMRDVPGSPSLLYYFVPPALVGDALELLPAYAGVLSPHPYLRDAHSGFPAVALHRRATKLHDKPISLRAMLDMVRDLSGTQASLLTEMLHILRSHPEHIHNGRLGYDIDRVLAAEKLPTPARVTPSEAVLDHGERTGKKLSKSQVQDMFKQRQKQLAPPTTRVQRS